MSTSLGESGLEARKGFDTFRSEMRRILSERFNEEELRTLAFDFGCDYDDLPGQGKAAKARDFVAYCERRGSIRDILIIGKQQRPDIRWPHL